MIFSASLDDRELKQAIKEAIESKTPGYQARDIAIIPQDNQRNPDTFTATARMIPVEEKSDDVTAELRDWVKMGNVVVGYIYGDKKGRFPDGAHIHTSTGTINGDILTTRNSVYKLIGEGKGL